MDSKPCSGGPAALVNKLLSDLKPTDFNCAGFAYPVCSDDTTTGAPVTSTVGQTTVNAIGTSEVNAGGVQTTITESMVQWTSYGIVTTAHERPTTDVQTGAMETSIAGVQNTQRSANSSTTQMYTSAVTSLSNTYSHAITSVQFAIDTDVAVTGTNLSIVF